MTETNVQMLLDKRALDELIYRQANAVDKHDWVAYRSCFEDDVHFDFTDHTDRVIGRGFGIVKSGDQWVEQVIQAVSGFEGTSHVISNAVHEVKGDTAKSECQILADHFLSNDRGDPSITMAGIYTFSSVRKKEGWKIKTWNLKILWYRGNPSLYHLAGEKMRAK
jgi:3-phenylpropionate/cinnamic acid dioxygenase small subunit